jgi:hypothetical protein
MDRASKQSCREDSRCSGETHDGNQAGKRTEDWFASKAQWMSRNEDGIERNYMSVLRGTIDSIVKVRSGLF